MFASIFLFFQPSFSLFSFKLNSRHSAYDNSIQYSCSRISSSQISVIKNANFQNLTIENESGSAIFIQDVQWLLLDNCVFFGCQVENGNGGAIYCDVEGSRLMNVKSFFCCAKGDQNKPNTGYGQFAYIIGNFSVLEFEKLIIYSNPFEQGFIYSASLYFSASLFLPELYKFINFQKSNVTLIETNYQTGGFFSDGINHIQFFDNQFISNVMENTGEMDALVNLPVSMFQMQRNLFYNNSISGGPIFFIEMTGSNSYMIDIQDNLFISNNALSLILFNEVLDLTIINASVQDNSLSSDYLLLFSSGSLSQYPNQYLSNFVNTSNFSFVPLTASDSIPNVILSSCSEFVDQNGPSTPDSDKGFPIWLIIIIVVLCLVFLGGVIFLIYYLYKKKMTKESSCSASEKVTETFVEYQFPTNVESQENPLFQDVSDNSIFSSEAEAN